MGHMFHQSRPVQPKDVESDEHSTARVALDLIVVASTLVWDHSQVYLVVECAFRLDSAFSQSRCAHSTLERPGLISRKEQEKGTATDHYEKTTFAQNNATFASFVCKHKNIFAAYNAMVIIVTVSAIIVVYPEGLS